MKALIKQIKKNFEQPENSLFQLLILQGIGFAFFFLVRLCCLLSGKLAWYSYLRACSSLHPEVSVLFYRPWSLLTHLFVQDELLSFLYSMGICYNFGRVFSYLLGSRRLPTLYLTGSLAGAVVFLGLHTFSPYLRAHSTKLAGAHAGIYALIMGTAAFAPQMTFSLFLFTPIRLKHLAGLLLLAPLVRLSNGYGGIYIAQLSGALWGYLYIYWLKQGIEPWQPFVEAIGRAGYRFWNHFYRFVHKLYAMLLVPVGTRPSSHLEIFSGHTKRKTSPRRAQQNKSSGAPRPSQKALDALLDKVAAGGYAHLTPEEKAALFAAGQDPTPKGGEDE